jgi:hypothetical protein
LLMYNNWAVMYLSNEHFVSVSVNGTEIGHCVVDGFFSKYGNQDGVNYVGLVAEAHLVNFLESIGYTVDLLYSHNVEIRRISGLGVDYERMEDCEDVLEDMPADIRKVINEFTHRGVNIQVDHKTGVEVLFEGRMLCRWDSGDTFRWFLDSKVYASCNDVIFARTHEPFLLVLGLLALDLVYLCSGVYIENGRLVRYSKTKGGSAVRTELEKEEEFLDAVERALAEVKINLENHWEHGIRVSNKREVREKLCEKLRSAGCLF